MRRQCQIFAPATCVQGQSAPDRPESASDALAAAIRIRHDMGNEVPAYVAADAEKVIRAAETALFRAQFGYGFGYGVGFGIGV